MIKVGTYNGYDFYMEMYPCDTRYETMYNIVPENSPAPESGYTKKEYIEKIKGVCFPAWYDWDKWENMTELDRYREGIIYNRPDIAEHHKK
jgi:hypothetical protein